MAAPDDAVTAAPHDAARPTRQGDGRSIERSSHAVASRAMPLVMIGGMSGMNFAHAPISGHRNGLAILMALQFAAGIGLVWLLHRGRTL